MLTSGSYHVNQMDEFGYTPIHAAVSYGHVHVIDYLLSQKEKILNFESRNEK